LDSFCYFTAKSLKFHGELLKRRVHVRRTDKLKHEASAHSVDVYMYHVIAWYDNFTKGAGMKVVRKVFLAIDEIEVHKTAEKM